MVTWAVLARAFGAETGVSIGASGWMGWPWTGTVPDMAGNSGMWREGMGPEEGWGEGRADSLGWLVRLFMGGRQLGWVHLVAGWDAIVVARWQEMVRGMAVSE